MRQVGSGESFGNDDIVSDNVESDDEDDEWEDLEEWKVEPPTMNHFEGISTSNKWNTLPACPPKPKPKLPSNHIPQRPPTPPNPYQPGYLRTHNCISAYNNAYRLNGSLSESSESVPVQPPLEYQVRKRTSYDLNYARFILQMNHHGLHRPLSFNETQVKTSITTQHSFDRKR